MGRKKKSVLEAEAREREANESPTEKDVLQALHADLTALGVTRISDLENLIANSQ